ncbi:MAG TPA: protein translocase subunit SecD [Caulobacteraceae bacterium]|nr:protein translocase subunit SecD [Caulobacteraceae bacterium]
MLALSRWKIITVALSLVFGILYTLPNLLPQATLDRMPGWLPHQRLNLGLDLQGGSYLLLEVDTDALRKERLTNLTEDVRTRLRNEKIEISDLTNTGGMVSVRITDPTKVDQAYKALNAQLGERLTTGGKDVNVRTAADQHIQITFSADAAASDAAKAVDQSVEIIRRRIDALGTKEPAITRQGANRIVVEAPGESDPQRLKDVIGKTAKLTFQMVDTQVSPEDIQAGRVPPDDEILPLEGGTALAVKKRALVTGEMLTKAFGTQDDNGLPAVGFSFNGQGAARFATATAQNVGKPFAIVLDKKIISAPRINGPIPGGNGIITGSFTAESAHDMAVVLQSGALPAPLKVEEQRTVGAELGADAVRAGEVSLAIGAAAIFAFIILAYGSFGVYAAIALVVNVLLMVGALSATQATLTLPGIAGLILTMAVAVDANVLIYERMRDEAHAGRTPMAAADHGYQRAMVSIFDADVTTMISALIMFQFGAGPVKGFAWTLSIGVLTSVFTAIVVTQLLIGLWFRIARPKALPIA